MYFVDGENLAIRFAALFKSRAQPLAHHVKHRPDTYVWSPRLTQSAMVQGGGIVRSYYYTSVQGDHPAVVEVADELKALGIEAPRVFKKTKGGRTKRVDITLSTDMLGHAHRHHYDVALLFAGDEDYVPLVEAVQREGRRVHLCFVSDGLSPILLRACDGYTDITEHLLSAAV